VLIYRFFSIIFFPFIELYLFYRVYKKKEDKKRLKERFGKSTQLRPQGDIIWLHAVSVGETNSVLILIDELLKNSPQLSILFTSTTLNSATIIATKIPQFKGRVIHQFLPIDSYYCVQNFFYFWQPKTAIFVESEIWPNLISVAKELAIPTFLVNARMSEKSAKKWQLAKIFGFKIFDYFDAIFAQSQEDKERLEKLCGREIFFYGNLKSQAQNLLVNSAELEKLKSQIASRKFWLATSTHKGEEEIILQVHQILKKDFADLLTIIVPRHPSRADEIKSLFNGINFAQRSQNQDIESSTEIYLADSLNELGTFYSLANFAFIGGSLLEIGGHNPFEAIKLNCAVISGSQVFNFKEIYKSLEQQNACAIINSSDELAKRVKDFLSNENDVEAMSTKALEVIKNSDNIAAKLVETIESFAS
jgi:3-deoxy-D-manno-octulosonic-acid transferase